MTERRSDAVETRQHDELRMRCYLLGTLNAEEMIALDARCLADQEYRLAFWEVEAQLIEDYIRGRLSPAEKAAFEGHYLSTPRNQEHVALITGMMAKQRARGSAFLSTRTVWLAAAVLIVSVLGGSFALLHGRRRETAEPSGRSKAPLEAEARLHDAEAKLLAFERNKLAVMSLGQTARGESGLVAPSSLVIPDGATEVTLVVPRDVALGEPKKATLYSEGATSRMAIDTPRLYVPPHSTFALAYVKTQVLQPGSYQIEMDGQRSVAFRILQK